MIKQKLMKVIKFMKLMKVIKFMKLMKLMKAYNPKISSINSISPISHLPFRSVSRSQNISTDISSITFISSISRNNSRLFYREYLLLLFTFVTVLCLHSELTAQPYIDPIQVRYMQAFRTPNTPATPFTHLYAGSDLPVRLKGDAILLFSPYYDQWNLDSAQTDGMYPTVHSLALPVGLIMPIMDTKWTITVLPFVRTNGEELFGDRTFQFGGAALAGLALKPHQKFRLGVYASGEFFGLFIIPLLGVDWRIDDRNYLFGVLPGRLTFEHQWNDRLFGGATFRAPTTSYRFADGSFMRLDDNQISAFVDYYITKEICVTVEPGYGLLRRIRTGVNSVEYLTKVHWGDGFFLKVSAAYRIRFEK